MEHKLTMTAQHSKRCSDGRRRNFFLFFIDGVQVMSQKIPYDETMEWGYDGTISLENVYYENGSIHQTRVGRHKWDPVKKAWGAGERRQVKFPVSRKFIGSLNLQKEIKIELTERRF